MEKHHVDLFIIAHADKFKPDALPAIKQKLEQLPDDQFITTQMLNLQNPTTILLIALFLGWERFFLDDIGLGILKIITCGGFGIWYLIDIFTACDRTKNYNFRKFNRYFI
ncbi:MAG: TM2 domain-containing protein [Odoribacteraceae bacterium]|jgi:TM2 domain-containing membrane protein YozV|nr:TM2 domain-containing protein [Odoribacteraceae bacterium]